ncbi:MAG: sulfotransferase [Planctomycetota bacterium]
MSRPTSEFVASGVPMAPIEEQRWYAPRIWHGMSLGVWMELLREKHFRVHPTRYVLAGSVFPLSLIPSVAGKIQHARYGDQAQSTPMVDDPIIVTGHWRSGTTLLHELFALDQRLSYPTTFQCFNPLSFRVSGWFMKPLTQITLPEHRPMDNLRVSWDAPQEDEFALLNMGLPTPYRRIAWPNHPAPYLNYLDMEGLSEAALETWKEGLLTFLQYLNLFVGKRLVLKSPPHTGRMAVLRQIFPNARFVHITREPERLIPSTMHLWAALDHANALRVPNFKNLREYVFTCFERMYRGYLRDEPEVPETHLITIRFRDLVKDTEQTMRQVYQQLELGDFDECAAAVREYMGRNRDYKQNQHPMVPDLQAEIDRRCGFYRDRFMV